MPCGGCIQTSKNPCLVLQENRYRDIRSFTFAPFWLFSKQCSLFSLVATRFQPQAVPQSLALSHRGRRTESPSPIHGDPQMLRAPLRVEGPPQGAPAPRGEPPQVCPILWASMLAVWETVNPIFILGLCTFSIVCSSFVRRLQACSTAPACRVYCSRSQKTPS